MGISGICSGSGFGDRMITLTPPRRCVACSYAIISGWTRSWLWRGWTKPLPHPDVLARAGEDAEAIFGLTQMEKIQFDSEARSPVAAARELLDRVVSADPPSPCLLIFPCVSSPSYLPPSASCAPLFFCVSFSFFCFSFRLGSDSECTVIVAGR